MQPKDIFSSKRKKNKLHTSYEQSDREIIIWKHKHIIQLAAFKMLKNKKGSIF